MRAESIMQIAVEPRRAASPMPEFMNKRAAKSLRSSTAPAWRHLGVIWRGQQNRAAAAIPDHSAAVGEDDLGGLRRAPGRFLDRGRHVSRNALDLTGMEQGESEQQRNPPHRLFVIIRYGVAALVVAQL